MSSERLVTLLSALSSEQFVSGTALAEKLGLSRASVHLALQSAARYGVEIERVTGRGYRLLEPLSWLNAEQIQQALGAEWQIEVLPEIDSSNAELLRRPSTLKPFCLAAELQTAGRGRRGRSWSGALAGSLLFSVAWPFFGDMTRLSGLSLVVGLALAEALDRCGVPRVRLKWPNDVIVDYRKLAGILIEVQAEANSPCRAIIGIGLNIKLPALVRDEIDQAVVDLAQLGVPVMDRNLILIELLKSLEYWLQRFAEQGFAGCRQEWELRHAYQGETVRLSSVDGGFVVGRVSGLGDGGELLVETDAGIKPFTVGEISLRREA